MSMVSAFLGLPLAGKCIMTGAELIFSCKPTQLTWFISYTIQPTEMSQKYEIEYASGMRATAAMKQTGD